MLGVIFFRCRINLTKQLGLNYLQVHVSGPHANIVLWYGMEAEVARHRLLRHAHHRAVNLAWDMEKK